MHVDEIARRSPSASMTAPWFTSSTSTASISKGSQRTPSISFSTTRGRETASS